MAGFFMGGKNDYRNAAAPTGNAPSPAYRQNVHTIDPPVPAHPDFLLSRLLICRLRPRHPLPAPSCGATALAPLPYRIRHLQTVATLNMHGCDILPPVCFSRAKMMCRRAETDNQGNLSFLLNHAYCGRFLALFRSVLYQTWTNILFL